MRKIIILLVIFVMLLFSASTAFASVRESVYVADCTIYTWSDAVKKTGSTVEFAPTPWYILAELGYDKIPVAWAEDSEAEMNFADAAGFVEEIIGQLTNLGVPAGILEGYDIMVLPASRFYCHESVSQSPLGGVAYAGKDKKIIVAGLRDVVIMKNIFLHEIGHLVHEKIIGARGYGWAHAGEKGREYLALRKYPDVPLGCQEQIDLPWADRASEWFAEDFGWWAADGAYFSYSSAPAAGRVVKEYFGKLFG